MAVVTELVTRFVFRGNIKPLENFNSVMGQSIKKLGAFALVNQASIGVFDAFVVSTLKAAEAQVNLSQSIGISIEKLQELGYAASVSGSSADALESSLDGLSKVLGGARQYGSAEFSRLGISILDVNGNLRQTDDVLFDIGKRFKELSLSIPEQQNFASSLGIDPSLIGLLSKTGSEIDALRAKARALGVMNKKQAEGVIEFNNSITTLKFGLVSLQRQIALGLSPTVKSIAERFTAWSEKNRDGITKTMEKIFEVIMAVGGAIGRLIGFVDDIVRATVGWEVVITALGVAIFIALSPINKIITAIGAVLLVIDDLIVAFQGGKSVIRDFFLEFFGFDIMPVLQGIVKGFKWMVSAISSIIKPIIDVLKWIFGKIFTDIPEAARQTGDFLKDDPATRREKTVQAAADFGKGLMQNGKNLKHTDLFYNIPGAGRLFGNPNNASSTNNTNTINQDIKIEIKTSDPQQAGRSVEAGLQNQLQDAQSQIAYGGR